MKGYTDFAMGFLGAGAIATKPMGKTKYMDWNKVKEIIKENPNSVINVGLMMKRKKVLASLSGC